MHKPARRPAVFTWKYDPVELIADGVVHALGISLGLVGAVAIVFVAASSARSEHVTSVVIYSVGLLAMLGLSAAYNTWPVSRTKWILLRFDQSAIYLMIAGTYTPFIAQIKNDLFSICLLIGVWLTAAAGVALKLLVPGRFGAFSIVLYLLLGWSGAVVYQPIAAVLPSASIWLLVVGGALYTIGVVFHLWRSLRFQNVIWQRFRVGCCLLSLFGVAGFCRVCSSVISSTFARGTAARTRIHVTDFGRSHDTVMVRLAVPP